MPKDCEDCLLGSYMPSKLTTKKKSLWTNEIYLRRKIEAKSVESSQQRKSDQDYRGTIPFACQMLEANFASHIFVQPRSSGACSSACSFYPCADPTRCFADGGTEAVPFAEVSPTTFPSVSGPGSFSLAHSSKSFCPTAGSSSVPSLETFTSRS